MYAHIYKRLHLYCVKENVGLRRCTGENIACDFHACWKIRAVRVEVKSRPTWPCVCQGFHHPFPDKTTFVFLRCVGYVCSTLPISRSFLPLWSLSKKRMNLAAKIPATKARRVSDPTRFRASPYIYATIIHETGAEQSSTRMR